MDEQILSEIQMYTSRSSGPGGQHANKVESRVELHWNMEESESLTDEEKNNLREKIGRRLTEEGVLILVSQNSRSQLQNRDDVKERFLELIRNGIVAPKKRVKTKPSKGAVERRLKAKKAHSEKKKRRRDDIE